LHSGPGPQALALDFDGPDPDPDHLTWYDLAWPVFVFGFSLSLFQPGLTWYVLAWPGHQVRQAGPVPALVPDLSLAWPWP
jgi:hypothetical protein